MLPHGLTLSLLGAPRLEPRPVGIVPGGAARMRRSRSSKC